MIIGLSGAKGSGKSTAAQMLEEKGYKRYSFAGPLRDIVSKVFDIPMEKLTDPNLKETECINVKLDSDTLKTLYQYASHNHQQFNTEMAYNRYYSLYEDKTFTTPRALLQYIGTEAFRDPVSESYWIDCFFSFLDKTKAKRVICDDVRFPNEASAIRKTFGVIIGVNRPGLEKSSVGAGHASENQSFDKDFILFNTQLNEFKQDVLTTVDLAERGAGRH